jgi:hypothetical protein
MPETSMAPRVIPAKARIQFLQDMDPLTRPAPAGEDAGCGPPSPPRGRGTLISLGGPQAHVRSE